MSWRRTPLPPDWPARRRRVLDRDQHQCQLRGPRCAGEATDVDHIGDRDDHSDANLRSACGPCHDSRTGQQARAVQGFRRRPPAKHPGLRSAHDSVPRDPLKAWIP